MSRLRAKRTGIVPDACQICNEEFRLLDKWRHHCKSCCKVVCSKHSTEYGLTGYSLRKRKLCDECIALPEKERIVGLPIPTRKARLDPLAAAKVKECELCYKAFGAKFWRHHCRLCFREVCSRCSEFQLPLSEHPDGARVCDKCYSDHQTAKNQPVKSPDNANAVGPQAVTGHHHEGAGRLHRGPEMRAHLKDDSPQSSSSSSSSEGSDEDESLRVSMRPLDAQERHHGDVGDEEDEEDEDEYSDYTLAQSDSIVSSSLASNWDAKRDRQLEAIFQVLDKDKKGYVFPEVVAMRPWRMDHARDGSDRFYLPEFLNHWRSSKLAGLPGPDFDKVMDQMKMAAMTQMASDAQMPPIMIPARGRTRTQSIGNAGRYTGSRGRSVALV